MFASPHDFVLNRPNIGKHVAFGVGPHRCAGAPLATLMLRVTLEELLSRATSIEQAGEPTMTGWPEWGTLSAPVRLAA
jgi:cytochrome P450